MDTNEGRRKMLDLSVFVSLDEVDPSEFLDVIVDWDSPQERVPKVADMFCPVVTVDGEGKWWHMGGRFHLQAKTHRPYIVWWEEGCWFMLSLQVKDGNCSCVSYPVTFQSVECGDATVRVPRCLGSLGYQSLVRAGLILPLEVSKSKRDGAARNAWGEDKTSKEELVPPVVERRDPFAQTPRRNKWK